MYIINQIIMACHTEAMCIFEGFFQDLYNVEAAKCFKRLLTNAENLQFSRQASSTCTVVHRHHHFHAINIKLSINYLYRSIHLKTTLILLQLILVYAL